MIAIIDYKAGNIGSLQNALQQLQVESIVTADETIIRQADKVIFPGVGAASWAMIQLRSSGLDRLIPTLSQPVLGICLGMQLMCSNTEEGNTKGLDIFKTEVKKFPPTDKIPHMGWNNISNLSTPLFDNIREHEDVYFIHSYYAQICEDTIATCDYMLPFSAALRKNNFYGTQFHPEKSATLGSQIIKNFINL